MNHTLKKTPLPLIALFCLLPAIQTTIAVYLQWYPAITYPSLKLLMTAVPMVVWLKSNRSWTKIKELGGLKQTSLLPGLTAGLLMAGIIILGYYVLLRSLLNPAPLITKVSSLNLLEYYWIFALFISLWNSMFEEYYWRLFLLVELAGHTENKALLCTAGGILFGLHHIIVLLPIFEPPVVAAGAAGTMIAGGIWTWMRLYGYSIFDCYISHVLADLSIMWIGYDLINA